MCVEVIVCYIIVVFLRHGVEQFSGRVEFKGGFVFSSDSEFNALWDDLPYVQNEHRKESTKSFVVIC